jgi:hypothetical protein
LSFITSSPAVAQALDIPTTLSKAYVLTSVDSVKMTISEGIASTKSSVVLLPRATASGTPSATPKPTHFPLQWKNCPHRNETEWEILGTSGGWITFGAGLALSFVVNIIVALVSYNVVGWMWFMLLCRIHRTFKDLDEYEKARKEATVWTVARITLTVIWKEKILYWEELAIRKAICYPPDYDPPVFPNLPVLLMEHLEPMLRIEFRAPLQALSVQAGNICADLAKGCSHYTDLIQTQRDYYVFSFLEQENSLIKHGDPEVSNFQVI